MRLFSGSAPGPKIRNNTGSLCVRISRVLTRKLPASKVSDANLKSGTFASSISAIVTYAAAGLATTSRIVARASGVKGIHSRFLENVSDIPGSMRTNTKSLGKYEQGFRRRSVEIRLQRLSVKSLSGLFFLPRNSLPRKIHKSSLLL